MYGDGCTVSCRPDVVSQLQANGCCVGKERSKDITLIEARLVALDANASAIPVTTSWIRLRQWAKGEVVDDVNADDVETELKSRGHTMESSDDRSVIRLILKKLKADKGGIGDIPESDRLNDVRLWATAKEKKKKKTQIAVRLACQMAWIRVRNGTCRILWRSR